MTDQGARRLARTLFAVEAAMAAAAIWFSLLESQRATGSWESGVIGDVLFAVAFVLMFPVIGLVLATRQPRNALGWGWRLVVRITPDPET